MSVAERIKQLRASLPEGVALIAVSKFHPAEVLQEAYNAGQRIFGESRAQELTLKQKQLPQDIEWHFIGTLQRNKVKDIASFIHTIHSVDSLKLLEEINKQAAKSNRIIRVLLEVHVAQEETKHGFTPEECRAMLQQLSLNAFPNIQICGLMSMATYTEDKELIRKEFKILKNLFNVLKNEFFSANQEFKELSIGMSHDYPIAIEEGGTMIRVGTLLFGEREY